MAFDPSTHIDTLRKHVRNPTPVIPALPLALTDRKWRRRSQQLPTQKQQPESTISSPERQQVQCTAPSFPPAEAPPGTDTNEPEGQAELQDDPSLARDGRTEAGERHAAVANEDEARVHQQEQEQQRQRQPPNERDTTTAELKSQGNNTVNEDVAGPMDPENEPQVATAPRPRLAQETVPATEAKRVRLAEEDTLSSEQEISSVPPSAGTGLTDYGSPVAESTLEPVVDDTQHTRRTPGKPHRKSEIAPEVSINGVAPRAAHDYHPSGTANGSSSSSSHPILAEPTSLPQIQDYLLFLSSSKQFSDVVIQLNQADRSYQPSLHTAHWLLLMRSEKLSKVTPDYDQTTQSKVINLYPARNVLPHAFESAIKFFYADYVLTLQALFPQASFAEPQVRAQALEYVMSYWISGVELGLGPVKTRAYELVKELLDLDVAEFIAKEVRNLRVAIGGLPTKHAQEEIKDIADTLSRLLAQLLSRRLNLDDFVLVTDSPGLALPPRFAELESYRSSHPALSGMVFGSLPSQPSSSAASIASSIMLNVDFETLAIIASELMAYHGRSGEDAIRRVVAQREETREQVVSNRAISNKQRLDNSDAWHAAGFKELIDEHGQLKRERVGFILPTRNR